MPTSLPSLPRWLLTLKFKIVAMAVVTGVLSAVGTAQMVLPSTQQSIERLLLEGAADDRAATAALLYGKLDTLQTALVSVARHAAPSLWDDPAAMSRYLVDKPALSALFDSVFAATPDGVMLARLNKGVPTRDLPNVADREYFRRAMRTDQPVVSTPLMGKVSKTPLVIIAAPVLAADGQVIGTIAGSLGLQSSALFYEIGVGARDAGTRDLVMDRTGVLLAHSDSSRVLGRAADEPGLASIVDAWQRIGSPIQTEGTAVHEGGWLVSMAGIPTSDWVLVRLTPEASAMAPVMAARGMAWRAAAVVGLAAALLAGGLAWFMTRPISALRARAEQLLHDDSLSDQGWPRQSGEIGDLSRAFQHVVAQRTRRQSEAQALLTQLEAVLDHAEVGIALTRNGRFELVSRHFCHIFRCEKGDVVGQSTRLIYASDEAFAHLAARAHPAFMAHGAFDGELRLMRRPGQEFWAHMRGRAVLPGDPAQGTIWTVEDVTAAREHRERLTYTASHDALTGLSNRAAFEQMLDDATRASAQSPFCALFIDLDRFKQVNDTGGHAAGDALLRDVAHQLVTHVRQSDVVARLGGDEFAVLLPNCPDAKARQVAETLRAAVVDCRLVWGGQSLGVGASIGLVSVRGDHATAADVLRAADAACYAAKRQGRNRVEVHAAAADALPSLAA